MASSKITVSAIKADIGGLVGHSGIHPDLLDSANENLEKARSAGDIIDYHATNCGDDLNLIITHTHGDDSEKVHRLAWNIFEAGTEVAKGLKLYGAGQDLIADAFSGNVKGMGPGVAEMTFDERPAEPLIVFMADKTSAGAWNLPLYRMFADPFNTAGLVISPALHEGFKFSVLDVRKNREITFECPKEIYDLLVFIGAPARYTVDRVYTASGEIAASSSTERLSIIAGQYVGKDDPVMLVRAQSQFPAVGEVLEAFSYPQIVEGWMRGSHHGPLMPVPVYDAQCTRFDGPPRVCSIGFQVSNGMLVGPRDLFDDPAWDKVRAECLEVADVLRRHGPFEPHRLPMEEMEYTTLPQVMERLESRWEERREPQSKVSGVKAGVVDD